MATQDIGNGVKTSLTRIVAQTFGVEPESINLEIGSSKHPHGPTAGGSRVTPSVYTPTEQASQLMKDRLFGVVAEEFDLNNPSFVDGGLQHQDGFLSWEEALQTINVAIEGVSPLPQTGYKVPLVYGTVLETLNRAYNRVWGGEG